MTRAPGHAGPPSPVRSTTRPTRSSRTTSGLTDGARRMRHEPGDGLLHRRGRRWWCAAPPAPATRRARCWCRRSGSPSCSPEIAGARLPGLRRVVRGAARPSPASTCTAGSSASFGRLPRPRAGRGAGRRRAGSLVLEAMNNHTNLGAVFRSAAGLGMDAVLLSPDLRRPALPAVRAGLDGRGVRRAVRLPRRLARRARPTCATRGFRVLAMTPAPDAVPLSDVAAGRRRPGRPAARRGGPGADAGGDGRASDERVRIPMAAGVDSLNVGAAAAIACYALGRRPGP